MRISMEVHAPDAMSYCAVTATLSGLLIVTELLHSLSFVGFAQQQRPGAPADPPPRRPRERSPVHSPLVDELGAVGAQLPGAWLVPAGVHPGGRGSARRGGRWHPGQR